METENKTLANPEGSVILLGENKAISSINYAVENGKEILGVVVHMPIRQEGPKTFYKPLGVRVEITAAQREAIIMMLEGKTR